MVDIKDTFGLWERSIITWPDGRRDTSTYVGWLQGPTIFSDLRQPIDPPSFEGVSCLNDLGPEHFGWLARQEGFAGRFVRIGNAFEWQRIIDFQCTSIYSDVGYLEFQGDILVETGRDVPYVEHWHRASRDFSPHYALRMIDQTGRQGFIVRGGAIFMYVRDRVKPLEFNASLPDLVSNATAAEARALLDCEISLGRVQESSWIIQRSSLPYRVGKDLAVSFSPDRTRVQVSDITDDGQSSTHGWTTVEIDSGSLDATA